MHRPAVGPEGHAGHAGLHVAGVELLVLLLRGKQRGLAGVGGGGAVLVQRGDDLGQAEFLIGIERRAQRHVQKAVFGAQALDAQGLVKAGPQHGAEGEGPAQIQNVAGDGPPLGQARDGLVHHRLVDGGGNVAGQCALVDEGLHVALGEHAAAGRNGVGALGRLGGLVHLIGAHLQQGGHLVDEGAGAAGTAAVHAHLGAVGQKEDLGVLAAQLNDAVGAGGQLVGGHAGGKNLLHKGHAAALGQAHAGGAGDGQQQRLAVHDLVVYAGEDLLRLLHNVAVMSLVCMVDKPLFVIQHHALDGGGANIQACSHGVTS